MSKPFVVCHMLASLDGKIDGDFFGSAETGPARQAYGDLRPYYQCQATVYGTTTMLGGYADGTVSPEELQAPSSDFNPEEDYIDADGRALGNFIVSFDTKANLRFHSPTLEKKGRPAAHVIEVLTYQARPAYLAYLRRLGISYVFAGRADMSLSLLLEKLQSAFGVTRVMVAGGGVMNWSFLQKASLTS